MKRYNKMICRMCSNFAPISARAGKCKVDGEERLAYKACVNREDFELHPKGRARNLRGEVNIKNRAKGEDVAEGADNGNSKSKVKSGGNEKPKTDGQGVSGKREGAGTEPVSEGEGATPEPTGEAVSESTGKGDKGKPESKKTLIEKMGFSKKKKKSNKKKKK